MLGPLMIMLRRATRLNKKAVLYEKESMPCMRGRI